MTQLSSRRHDLDWLRIIAFMILIFYHTGMFYVSWDFHVKSAHAGPDAEWLMLLSNPWRLSLLFLISGIAIRFAADKTPPSEMAKSRLVRLGLPILTGMVLIVAPQSYLELIEKGEFAGSFTAFYPLYLDFGSSFSIITPTWNHLWYVVYLLAYTLILVPLAGPVRRVMDGVGGRMTEVLFRGRRGVLALLVLPVLPHWLFNIALAPFFPTTHNFVWDFANHAHSFTVLLIGFVLAKDEAFWSAVHRAFPLALVLMLVLALSTTPIRHHWEYVGMQAPWLAVPVKLATTAFAWLVIVCFLGFGQRFLNRSGKALAYMTEAIFPWYILHQTLIIMAGFWLTRQGLNVWVEFAGVLIATIGGCALLHEFVIRRSSVLRPLFGLKPKRLPASAVQPAE
jgi:hypothetical protein